MVGQSLRHNYALRASRLVEEEDRKSASGTCSSRINTRTMATVEWNQRVLSAIVDQASFCCLPMRRGQAAKQEDSFK